MKKLISPKLFGKIILFMIVSFAAQADAYEDAIKTVGNVIYKEYGYEKNLNEYLQKQVPEDYKEFVNNWSVFAGMLVNKEVRLEWKF